METEALVQLNRINKEFYQDFADSFSRTRWKIQPGVASILEKIPENGNWLDIGCGNGNLAREWVKKGYQGFFCGIDFSHGLIADARKNVHALNDKQKIAFYQVDLNQNDWMEKIPAVNWDGIFCFSVLHHIPGKRSRRSLCERVRRLLSADKICYISVWQPLNSPRLSKRIISWESVGIALNKVDSGDVLLDWRAHRSVDLDKPALRYVHIFSEDELKNLARESGFIILRSYYSDGKEGNLGLYQYWRANS